MCQAWKNSSKIEEEISSEIIDEMPPGYKKAKYYWWGTNVKKRY